MIRPGEKRRTRAKERVIIAQMHICPDGKKGGSIVFVFEDEPALPFQQRMGYKKWISYELV
jgi:hypothetical protein